MSSQLMLMNYAKAIHQLWFFRKFFFFRNNPHGIMCSQVQRNPSTQKNPEHFPILSTIISLIYIIPRWVSRIINIDIESNFILRLNYCRFNKILLKLRFYFLRVRLRFHHCRGYSVYLPWLWLRKVKPQNWLLRFH